MNWVDQHTYWDWAPSAPAQQKVAPTPMNWADQHTYRDWARAMKAAHDLPRVWNTLVLYAPSAWIARWIGENHLNWADWPPKTRH